MNKKSIYQVILVLSLLGIILAAYLLYSFFAPKPPTLCSVNNQINCNEVVKGGSLSTIFGIPVAAIGLAGYIVILISTLLKKDKLILGMAIFGALFCLRITILELFVVKIVCPVCLLCQLDMVAVTVFGFLLIKKRT